MFMHQSNLLCIIFLGSWQHSNCYVEIKMPTRCIRWIFIADLIACSTCFGHLYAHHQELESIIQVVAVCRIWCLVFKLSVQCGVEGCVSGLRAAAAFFRQNTREQPSPFYPHHEERWGADMQLHSFIISPLVGSERSASCPDQFSPKKQPLGTHWTGCWVGWVGPKVNPANLEKTEMSSFCQEHSDTCCDLQPAVWIKEW
jgi:hypothetical protein